MSRVLKTGRVIKTVKAYGERPKEPTKGTDKERVCRLDRCRVCRVAQDVGRRVQGV